MRNLEIETSVGICRGNMTKREFKKTRTFWARMSQYRVIGGRDWPDGSIRFLAQVID